MQLLHLEGPSDKTSKLTAIPKEKSRLDFVIKQGGNLYADNVSVLDSVKQEDFGEIIFETGMDDLTLSISSQTELNKTIFQKGCNFSMTSSKFSHFLNFL